jgi:phenylacetate-CoA ligase
LLKIPILTKDVLQRHSFTDFLDRTVNPRQCVIKSTSGSTGKPLQILRSPQEQNHRGTLYIRALAANGLRPWHKRAIIVAANRIPLRKSLLDQVQRSRKIFLLSDANIQHKIDVLESFQPQAIRGYNQSLKFLAYALKIAGIKDITPRFVFGTAEILDQPARSLINEVFGVEMVDIYGSIEAGCIAWECPHHCGYHLNVDTLFLEYIRDGKSANSGEPGRIVVTPLDSYAMPLIRYDLGDIGLPMETQCDCGRGLPLMRIIQGRADDFITLSDGTIIPPIGTFDKAFELNGKVLEYSVVQESLDLIAVKLVYCEGEPLDIVEKVKDRLEELIRHLARVKIEIVDHIDTTPGGKLRRISSNIPVKF